MPVHATIVIPCYNEAERLDAGAVLAILERDGMHLLLVDDGSSDGTLGRLHQIAERHPERVDVLGLSPNQGKAEAVRAGLRHALEHGADIVGYADADMATPASEMCRLVAELASSDARAVIGSRVAVLGANIQRKHTRHYLGRVFATFASMILRAPVYDTQCGAKVFRRSADLDTALAEPFRSRWAFDIELLGRLMVLAGDHRAAGIVEAPLREWVDVDGSKIKPTHMVKTGLELARIHLDLQRLRKQRG